MKTKKANLLGYGLVILTMAMMAGALMAEFGPSITGFSVYGNETNGTNETTANETLVNGTATNETEANNTLSNETAINETINETYSNETALNDTPDNETIPETEDEEDPGLGIEDLGTQANCGGAVECRCGDTLISDWTMTGDLQNDTGGTICPGDGLLIGASGITLDCQGHTLKGDYSGFSDEGIHDTTTRTDITIKNCIITDFYGYGIYSDYSGGSGWKIINNTINRTYYYNAMKIDSSSATIENNTLTNVGRSQYYPIYLYSAENSVIRGNNISDASHGIYVYYSSNDVLIENNRINNVTQNMGIYIANSDRINITGNIISNTGPSAYAIGIWDGADYARVINNTVTNASFVGIRVGDSTFTTLINNTVENAVYGFEFTGDAANEFDITTDGETNKINGKYLYWKTA